jgi:hypothetical protein
MKMNMKIEMKSTKILAPLIWFLLLPLAHGQQAMNLDDFAVEMEASRLRSAVGLESHPEGFVVYFFGQILPAVRESQIDFSDVELALRRQNTGLYLMAAPKSALEDSQDGVALCIQPVKASDGTADTWIYLTSRGPQDAQRKKQEFAIPDDATNLQKLKHVGSVTAC